VEERRGKGEWWRGEGRARICCANILRILEPLPILGFVGKHCNTQYYLDDQSHVVGHMIHIP
jgi:hypothetical protein